MKKLSLLICLLSLNAFACIKGNGFLPPNDMRLEVGYKALNGGGISEAEFNSVLDTLEQYYEPIIRTYGGELSVNRLWSDGTVNASANRQGSTYIINMYGGLARHDVISKDAFALVACHEVGHHIGGVPRYSDPGGQWASVEGQSDYFATSKCLRVLFMNDDNSSIVRQMQVPTEVTQKCEAQFSAQNDQDICKRISMAGHSAASLFANGRTLDFNTPDPAVVPVTDENHPDSQCRLDTYYNGAVCEIAEDIEIGQNDPDTGTCNRTENFTEGLRPLCWFRPGASGGGGENPPPVGNITATPLVNGQAVYQSSSPDQIIPISLDVRSHPGAVGFAIEVSQPNRIFSNPNSQSIDRVNGLWVEMYRGTTGVYRLLPTRQLPSWGRYQVRIIGLDERAQPVSRNSDPLMIILGR